MTREKARKLAQALVEKMTISHQFPQDSHELPVMCVILYLLVNMANKTEMKTADSGNCHNNVHI